MTDSSPDADPGELAAALVRLHQQSEADEGPSLVDYAEAPRVDDWTLRSALVRVAQPEPVRAGAVLEVIRRTDGALAPHRRRLEADRVPTAPSLAPPSVEGTPGRRVWDARSADLARVSVRFPSGDAVVAAYARAAGVDDDELELVPLLGAAVELDHLGDVLADWASTRPGPAPVGVIDDVATRVFARLDRLGVPRETGGRRR